MILKVRLTKLGLLDSGRTGPHAPRTESIVGESYGLPTVGRTFEVTGEALDEAMRAAGGFRQWTTSPVRTVRQTAAGIEFDTRNSRYLVQVLS